MILLRLMIICLIGMKLEGGLSLNQRIEDFRECLMTIGTASEVEDAKKWDNRVYLATYPRSGNHWMRYLIEEATGIATSSVYRDPDPPHLECVFPWGGYCCDRGYEGYCRIPMQNETVVVKTHFPAFRTSRFEALPYTRTIRIIRHPVDSFYSFYLWQQNYYNETAEYMIPRDKLRKYITMWRRFQEYWDSAENVLTIRYEDLYNSPGAYLKLILKHIDYRFEQEDIERAVTKHPPRGNFLKHLNHFTEEDLAIIQSELSSLMHQYGYGLRKIEQLY